MRRHFAPDAKRSQTQARAFPVCCGGGVASRTAFSRRSIRDCIVCGWPAVALPTAAPIGVGAFLQFLVPLLFLLSVRGECRWKIEEERAGVGLRIFV